MITNLRESKARLSELVQQAAAGEEIVITVHGTPKAKLVPIHSTKKSSDHRAWARTLRSRLKKMSAAPDNSSSEIIDDLRGHRH